MRHQRPPDDHHLLFAAGQIAADAGAEVAQAREVVIDALQIVTDFAPAAIDLPADSQVFFDGQMPEHRTTLDYLHDARADDFFRVALVNPFAVPCDRAAR